MNTEIGTGLLNKHFDDFMNRIGTYIGEVIKNNIKQEFTGMILILYTIIHPNLMESLIVGVIVSFIPRRGI